MEKFKVFSLTIFYAISFAITAFCTFGTIANSFSTRANYLSFMKTAAILALTFGLISLYLKRQITKLKDDEIENIALNIAIIHGGLVTASEIAANSSLGLNEATKFLEKCYSNGLCEKNLLKINWLKYFILNQLYHWKPKKLLNKYPKLKYNTYEP